MVINIGPIRADSCPKVTARHSVGHKRLNRYPWLARVSSLKVRIVLRAERHHE